MQTITADALLDVIKTEADPHKRLLVAIAGGPASGKSTIAAHLAAQLGQAAQVLPMDGFHLDNDTLIARDLLARKGAPDTFDAAGFARLIRRVKAGEDVRYPTFDRANDCTVPEAGCISADTQIVLAEGNYLLLNEGDWAALAGLFDLTVMLRLPRAVHEARLIQRWLDHGMTPEAARARAQSNDMRNVDKVYENARPADYEVAG